MQQDPTIPRSGRAQRLIAIICALALAASIAVLAAGPATATGDTTPTKPADDHQPTRPPGSKKGIPLQILAFNDYHGHLEADTPGDVDDRPAGGSEYLSTALTQLREGNEHSITVAAGDLVGGSPFFSGLFRDEPSVESLEAMGLDLSGVGNHEFDEGVDELRRLQYGGCHPVDGCFFPNEPYDGADFTWISSNVVDEHGHTPLSAYEIREFGGVPVAFIGMTLEATPTLVAQSGIEGFEFLDEVRTANRLVRYLKGHKGIRSFVVLLHEGGIQDDTGGIDTCEGISGPVLDIAAGLHPDIDVVVTGHTHEPYNCMLPDRRGRMRPVTSAFSFGRVVSEIDVKINPRTGNIRRKRTTATNHVVDQGTLAPDPALTAVLDKWRPLSETLGNRAIGTITADIVRGGDPTGSDRGVESPAGNLVADAQLWATEANGAQIALMNPGGVRSDLDVRIVVGR